MSNKNCTETIKSLCRFSVYFDGSFVPLMGFHKLRFRVGGWVPVMRHWANMGVSMCVNVGIFAHK